MAEVMNGEKLGTRGEAYFAGQAALVALTIFTPDILEPIATAAGAGSLLGGVTLVVTSSGYSLELSATVSHRLWCPRD